MSIDVEDQLSRLLDELADELDVPERWGSLEDLADADLRQVGPRPKVALAVAVAAALLLLVGTALIVRDRRGGAPVGTLRTASDATSASTVPSKPNGTWDPSGPRLTDAELAQVITPVAGPGGSTVWRLIEPNGRPSQRGTVTGLSIVRTSLADAALTNRYLGGVNMEASSALHYLAALPQPSPPTPVWVVAIDLTGHVSQPTCAFGTVDACPDGPGARRGVHRRGRSLRPNTAPGGRHCPPVPGQARPRGARSGRSLDADSALNAAWSHQLASSSSSHAPSCAPPPSV